MKLYELDRVSPLDHLTSIYVPKASLTMRNGYQEKDLKEIVRILRSEEGCPWDREQSLETLLPQILEEVYEYVDAVEKNDVENMYEELGDILLHIYMDASIAEEEDIFRFGDIVNNICEKMIRRHPHVFSDTFVKDSDVVLVNWEAIKNEEKEADSVGSRMDRIPNAFPALLRAKKIQKRAASVRFDWDNTADVMAKLDEEVAELKESVKKGDTEGIFQEFGDVLFTFVNISRFLSIDLESALRYSNNKFVNRFKAMEQMILSEGLNMEEMTLSEMDKFWDKAKRLEKVK